MYSFSTLTASSVPSPQRSATTATEVFTVFLASCVVLSTFRKPTSSPNFSRLSTRYSGMLLSLHKAFTRSVYSLLSQSFASTHKRAVPLSNALTDLNISAKNGRVTHQPAKNTNRFYKHLTKRQGLHTANIIHEENTGIPRGESNKCYIHKLLCLTSEYMRRLHHF